MFWRVGKASLQVSRKDEMYFLWQTQLVAVSLNKFIAFIYFLAFKTSFYWEISDSYKIQVQSSRVESIGKSSLSKTFL